MFYSSLEKNIFEIRKFVLLCLWYWSNKLNKYLYNNLIIIQTLIVSYTLLIFNGFSKELRECKIRLYKKWLV